jgi:iron complex outermembrane receptor protein
MACRFRQRSRHARFILSLSSLLAAVGGPQATAQTELPGIVVSTPSPVALARPAPRPRPQAPGIGQLPAAPPADIPSLTFIVPDAFVPLTVVTSREITATPGATLTDSLQYKPGISGTNFAPGANRPVIRGLDTYRVRVQENGIGSHDVSAMSEDHAVPIDPYAADQLEVVRGPATLRYGSQAIGGVVNASNDRIPEVIPPRGFRAEARGGLTSVDDGGDGAFKVTAGVGNLAVHADAFGRGTDDYDTPLGRQLNSFVDSNGFALGTSVVGTDGYIGVAFVNFNSLYGIPGGEAAEENKRIDMQQNKVLSKGEWRVRSHGIEAIRYWLGASSYAHNELLIPDGEIEIGSRFTNREQEGRIEVQHRPVGTALGELRGAVGTQIGHRNVRALSFEGDSLLEPARTDSIAAFWFEELQVTEKLRLQAAARIEQSKVDGTGLDFADPLAPTLITQERTFEPKSGSIGLLYELPLGIVARITAQYVERAPADAELFSKGAHEATGTFEIGNPFLSLEKAQTFELGFRRAKGQLRFDASAYYTSFDGFIFKQRTGETCEAELVTCTPTGAGGDLAQVLFQQRDAIFYGAEMLAELDIGRVHKGVWGIDGQYDFVRAWFDDAVGGNVPRIPPHRAGLGIYYRDASWYARTGFLHAFDQDRIGEFETPTKGYTLLSADLAYTWRKGPSGGVAPEVTIGIKGENLLDDDVRNHVSFKKDEVLLQGRNVRLYGIIKLN